MHFVRVGHEIYSSISFLNLFIAREEVVILMAIEFCETAFAIDFLVLEYSLRHS